MRNKVILIGGIAFIAYVLGNRARQSRDKNYEDFRHQVERLWTDPRAKRSRAKKRKQLAKKGRKLAQESAKAIRAKATA